MFTGRVKEGSRGGSGNFKWEDVKADHYRENYLGHSLMASVGRWQKNRDLQWYGKEAQKPAAQVDDDELKAIKDQEEELLAEALGVRPKRRVSSSVTKQELNQLTKEATGEVEAGAGVGWSTRNTAGLYTKTRGTEKADSDEEDVEDSQDQQPPPQLSNRVISQSATAHIVDDSERKKRKKEKKEEKKDNHKKKHRQSSSDDEERPTRRRRRRASSDEPTQRERSPPPRRDSHDRDKIRAGNRRDDYDRRRDDRYRGSSGRDLDSKRSQRREYDDRGRY